MTSAKNITGTLPLLARLWRELLSPLRRRIATAALCTLGLAGITALYPIVIQQAFDRFQRGDETLIWVLPPTIIVVTALRGGFLYAQQYVLQGTVLRALE
ncbi:MAG: ABC transporter ATP-binding protein, partial [Rhodospirillales bacterium]|nr:ABC transporter ATP-binding protein [Rhodospirillales bacterium]